MKMKVLVFDNYDSFTYNLVHLVEKITHQKVDVYRNDQLSLEQVQQYDKIILSPGPGIPVEAGLLLPLIKKYAATKSILGVCLGHQAIGQAFGGKVIRAPQLMHGKMSTIHHHGQGIFAEVPEDFEGTRYHSLIVEKNSLPDCLEVTAEADGLIMGLQHKKLNVHGVQFHPESIASQHGHKLLKNFLKLAGALS